MNVGKARGLVYARSAGFTNLPRRCEIQLFGVCTGQPVHWHHRLRDGQGGLWTPSNGLDLCAACHEAITNTRGNRALYLRRGWIIDSHDERPPAKVQTLIHTVSMGHAWVWLDDTGAFSPAPEPEDEAA
ncbi:hypothetical protein [Saccharothrix xinjiangensis]|uniref:HNH endonuclease n=1 Tax=Saccharothrix xinjiangensis TaxID=204798 RepID=A0ABV9XWW5_9PSEU